MTWHLYVWSGPVTTPEMPPLGLPASEWAKRNLPKEVIQTEAELIDAMRKYSGNWFRDDFINWSRQKTLMLTGTGEKAYGAVPFANEKGELWLWGFAIKWFATDPERTDWLEG